MSCIANFYLDGVKYSLEDYDVSTQTTKRLLQKVIASANSRQQPDTSSNHTFDHGDMLKELENPVDYNERQPLNECDDEEMLKDL